ncbi:MAG: hypothetical protein GDA39_00065 [Hyphomonadaceae bacterium]|nr:hypothetical protein [Hyphomonadaceae bacterium]MBC6411425.1 hypothetical protein [Hyphomonadaceae bacterium]
MALLQDPMGTRLINVSDIDSQGMPDPVSIGKLTETPHTREMRFEREKEPRRAETAGESS